MKLENPLKANDWRISSFFKFIASLQLALWVVLGLNAVGVQIPILREALALICLLFVPGIILLRVLRLHQLNVIEGVLYTVGLSAATVMLTGLFMNAAYVFITPRPLSLLPFMVDDQRGCHSALPFVLSTRSRLLPSDGDRSAPALLAACAGSVAIAVG